MSAEPNIDQLYDRHIKVLPRAAKLRLLAKIADALVDSEPQGRTRSARELLANAPSGRGFTTAAEVAGYIAHERGTWDS